MQGYPEQGWSAGSSVRNGVLKNLVLKVEIASYEVILRMRFIGVSCKKDGGYCGGVA
jgi:hypothetical protein